MGNSEKKNSAWLARKEKAWRKKQKAEPLDDAVPKEAFEAFVSEVKPLASDRDSPGSPEPTLVAAGETAAAEL